MPSNIQYVCVNAPVNVKPQGGGGARVGILIKVVEIDMGILIDDTEIGVGVFDSSS